MNFTSVVHGETKVFFSFPLSFLPFRRSKFEEALNTVEASGKTALSVSAAHANVTGAMLTRHTLLDVGVKYLEHLFASERYEEAARNMPKILGRQKTLWENEAYRFASANQLKVLAPFLPKVGT